MARLKRTEIRQLKQQVNRLEEIQEQIVNLSLSGMGTDLPGVKGTVGNKTQATFDALTSMVKIAA